MGTFRTVVLATPFWILKVATFKVLQTLLESRNKGSFKLLKGH